MEMNSSNHDHHHGPNRFAVIPTHVRLNADPNYTGKGVTLAFLDSGFYPHPDLLLPKKRIVAYKDLSNERLSLDPKQPAESWHWHGTQTSVAAAGSGHLCDQVYRGLASDADLILVKASEKGRVTEENIARGIRWIIDNQQRYNIRVLNISLGGDEDVSWCARYLKQIKFLRQLVRQQTFVATTDTASPVALTAEARQRICKSLKGLESRSATQDTTTSHQQIL